MQRKRFRVIKDYEKPLQPKTTNVKPSSLEWLEKTSSSGAAKKPTYWSKKKKSCATEETRKRRKCNSSTVFDTDAVQIKLVEHNNGREFIDDAHPIDERSEESPRRGRLTRIDEEEDSLKIEDFDQPPQSTSTPILCSSHNSSGHNIDSFMAEPYGTPSVFYSRNVYPYIEYGPQPLQDNSPLQSKYMRDQQMYSRRLPSHNYHYMPLEFPPVVPQPVEPLLQMNYPTSVYSGRTHHRSANSTPYQSDFLRYPYLSYAEPPLIPHRYSNSLSSGYTPSYRSSGGNATYRGTEQSADTAGDIESL